MAPTAPPAPTRTAIAGSVNSGELAETVPLTTALAAGVNTTPIEQLAPGPKLELQVLCVRLNGLEAEMDSSDSGATAPWR